MKKKLKICVISTTVIPCPPSGYAGLEMISWQCANGLKNLGHDVLLVAPNGSKTDTELHETTLQERERHAYYGYKERLKNFDVIIDHSWEKWSYISKMTDEIKCPILGVLHAPVHTMYNEAPPIEKPCFITISNDQGDGCREHLKSEARTVHNGVDVDFYKNNKKKRNDRYLFLARISTIKGPHIACNVALAAKAKLDVVGDDTLTGEPALVEEVKRACNQYPNLRYVGPQKREECVEWFNKNKTLLHPNELFREPFGLAPVEAQLCGMPVIAWDNGAMRETVKVGETGFLVKTQQEMLELVKQDAAASLKPERCREWASQFSYQNMVNRYEQVCFEAIESGGW